MTDNLLKQISAFPPLDDTVNKIMNICNNPNSSIMELSEVIKSDPMLTANILKSANSPLYGFSREIKSISQAVSIFGMETIKGFVFSSFLQKKLNLNLTPYNIFADDFAKISQKQNAFILKWYKGDRKFLDILSVASFLMEIGKIVLSNIIIENKKILVFRQELMKCKNIEQLCEFEENVFGLSNEDVAALIMENWNFVPQICNAIKFLNYPKDAKDNNIQKYAASLKAVKSIISTSAFDEEESLNISLNTIREFNLNEDKFMQIYEEIFEIA